MPNYLTLAEYSQFLEKGGRMLQSGIVDVLRKESFLLDKLQFPTVHSLKAKGLRIKTLPTLQNRKLNTHYVHSVGSIEPLEETGYLFGGRVDFDHRLTGKPDLIQDPAAWNVKMYAQALAYGWNHDFVNGDPAVNPDSITGMRYRMVHDFAPQIVEGGAIDISSDVGANLDENFGIFFDLFQEAMYKCREHTCDLVLTSSTVKLRIDSGLRQLGLFASTKDSFARTITTWGEGGPAIIDVGTEADQATLIMPDTETAAGLPTGGAASSLMFLKLGQDYVTGWQDDGGMKTFEWQEGVIKHIEMDWLAGLFITDPRSVAWLRNVVAK